MNKSALSIMGSALIASVLLVTASSFAVDAPVAAPADANGVSPTFESLTLGNGLELRNGSDLLGQYIDIDGVLYTQSTLADNLVAVGQIVDGEAVLITPDRIFNNDGDFSIKTGFNGNIILGGDAGDLHPSNVVVPGDLTVEGSTSLPIQQVSTNFDNARLGNKSIVATCPNGTRPLSCNIYFSAGHVNTKGPGSLIFGNGCFGGFYQENNNRVTGLVTAMCL